MIVIGIQGKEGSGKDFIAKLLKDNLHKAGITCSIISFSDFVRLHAANIMHQLYDINLDICKDRCNNPDLKNVFYEDIGCSPREFTCEQSDIAKLGNNNIFIDMWKDTINTSDESVILNPSIRTNKEADVIENMSGIHIRVQNNQIKQLTNEHHTENVIDKYTVTIIENDWNKKDKIQYNKEISDQLFDLQETIESVIFAKKSVCPTP